MRPEWGIPAVDLLDEDERSAVITLKRNLGFDVFAQPLFWEHVVACQLGGTTTAHGDLHDVDVTIWGRECRAEVKFGREYFAAFSPIRGKDWSHPVFKWALPRGCSGKEGVDACILVGLDAEGMIFSWVVPAEHIAANCASITLTTPKARKAGTHSRWDNYAVPFDALLPAFARACHNRYDAPTRRAGIRERANVNQATLPLEAA